MINAIIKYMMTAPVSGSIKVNIEGTKIIANTLRIKANSSQAVLVNLSLLKSVIILDNVIIKNIFINSLGWMVPIKGILNQQVALLTV